MSGGINKSVSRFKLGGTESRGLKERLSLSSSALPTWHLSLPSGLPRQEENQVSIISPINAFLLVPVPAGKSREPPAWEALRQREAWQVTQVHGHDFG